VNLESVAAQMALWFGLVDKATVYLTEMPATDVKDSAAIDRLIDYLERNRKWILCYAMRSKLKLPNSSNPVERCNNLVTARHQKHHGMSWSKNGSYALTALNAVIINNATVQWVEHRTLPLF
jgi:ribosome-interacting GTPase 1